MEAKTPEIVGFYTDPLTEIDWTLYADGEVIRVDPDDTESRTTYHYLPLAVFFKIYRQSEQRLKEAFATRFNLPVLI